MRGQILSCGEYNYPDKFCPAFGVLDTFLGGKV